MTCLETKRCPKCDEEKTLIHFTTDRRGRYRSWCRACNSACNQAYYHRERRLRERANSPKQPRTDPLSVETWARYMAESYGD